MDTREKIIQPLQARELLEAGEWSVIAGLFDPLTTIQARRIERLKRGRLLIVVLEGEDTLLPADARCSLVAALRSVDFVTQVVVGDTWHFLLPSRNTHIRVVEDWQAEKRLTEEFTRQIIARQEGVAS